MEENTNNVTIESPVTNDTNTGNNLTKNNNQNQIAGAIIVAGIIIAGAILLKDTVGGSRATTNSDTEISTIKSNARAVTTDDHIIGSPTSEVVIVEYSDTECPFCKVFHNTLHSVVEEKEGKVAWVYRHYPIPQLHQKATREAEATECAWDQGGNEGFWKYIDQVFTRTTSNDGLPESELPKIAGDIGLDVPIFTNCLASGKFAAKVQADIADAKNAGAVGTPYSLVVAKKEITKKMQTEIIKSLPRPDLVSFDEEKKNVMSLNGALPVGLVNGIVEVLLK
jgi:protein-disulfide isomerase